MKAVSLSIDDMVASGLIDDFDGEITKARFFAWSSEKHDRGPSLAVKLTIKPEDEEEIEQLYSAGAISNFAPSMDGDEPIDVDDPEAEGVYAIPVGKQVALGNSTNFYHFLQCLRDSGFPKEKESADIRFLEGVTAHFNRIPQKKRSGIVASGDSEQRQKTILVVTELKAVKAKAAAKSAGKVSTKSDSKANGSGDDLDNRLAELISGHIPEEGLNKAGVLQLVMKNYKGADKGAAVKRAGKNEFLGSREEWAFDVDEGTLIGLTA